jgi:hypothetical protein
MPGAGDGSRVKEVELQIGESPAMGCSIGDILGILERIRVS